MGAITACAGLLTLTKADLPAQPATGTPKKTEQRLPPGVVARLGVPRLPLRSPMTFAPDGQSFFGVTHYSVSRFDTATGKLVGENPFPKFLEGVISSHGRTVVSIDGNRVEVWDLNSTRQLLALDFSRRVTSLALSPDGKQLVTVGSPPGNPATMQLAVWNLTSGTKSILQSDKANWSDVLFSPDSKRLLTWIHGREVTCWNVRNARTEWISKSRSDEMVFAPDGKWTLSFESSTGWAAMDAATGRPIGGLKLPADRPYSTPAIAPDNRTLILPTKRGVVFWEMKEGRERGLLPGTSRDVTWGASFLGPFAPDGKSILINFGALKRYDIATGKPLWPDTTELGQTAPPAALLYSPDGRWLASGSNEDYTVRIWDMKNRRIAHTLRGHGSYVRALSFTPDSTKLITGGGDSTVRIWDVPTGNEIRIIHLHDGRNEKEHQQVVALAVSGDGNRVTTFGLQRLGMPNNKGDVYSVYDLSNGKLLERRQNAFGNESDIVHGLLAAGPALLHENGSIVGKNGVAGRPSPKKQEYESLHNSCIAARQFIAAAGVWRRDNPTGFSEVLVWEVATGQPIARLPVKELQQLAFDSSGSNLVTINRSEIQNWDIRTGKVVRSLAVVQTEAWLGATSLAISPDGKTAATGHIDATILLWDISPPESTPAPLTANERDKLWTDLADADAAKSFAALCRFANDPKGSLPFLKTKLETMRRPAAAEIKSLLSALQSPKFKARETSEKKLKLFADFDETPLHEALTGNLLPEARKRIETILANRSPAVAPQGDALRGVRTIWVLERIGTPAARKLLAEIAGGDGRMAREAKSALERR